MVMNLPAEIAPGIGPHWLVSEFFGLLGLALLVVTVGRHCDHRRHWGYTVAVLLILSAGIAMSSCGGGSGGGGSTSTPLGTYPLAVTGTLKSGSTTVTQNINLTLIVQ